MDCVQIIKGISEVDIAYRYTLSHVLGFYKLEKAGLCKIKTLKVAFNACFPDTMTVWESGKMHGGNKKHPI